MHPLPGSPLLPSYFWLSLALGLEILMLLKGNLSIHRLRALLSLGQTLFGSIGAINSNLHNQTINVSMIREFSVSFLAFVTCSIEKHLGVWVYSVSKCWLFLVGTFIIPSESFPVGEAGTTWRPPLLHGP